MPKIPVSAYRHSTKGGRQHAMMLLIPSKSHLLRGLTGPPQFYGFYSDRDGLHLVVTVKLPLAADNMMDIEAARTFEGVEWYDECWIGKSSRSGVRIYFGKGRASDLLKPGRYSARVWSGRFKGRAAYALDLTL